MKSTDNIPTGKLGRTTEIVKAGIKVGGNYVSHYCKKAVNPNVNRSELDEKNAEDIYNSLASLKGGALKVAQMLSMNKELLPQQYVDKFSLAQFSVPPLSSPLVRRVFRKHFNKNPEEVFDSFSPQAVNAASIGQVHKCELDGKYLAVKIQYPGVAESIRSDLKMIKPLALRLFQMSEKDSEKYFKEIEEKLLEETDYSIELTQSNRISQKCSKIKHLKFPKYYPELSCNRILTMDWIEGVHLSEFSKTNTEQSVNNQIGQALFDFYMYQLHVLKEVNADPHPGNFLVDKNFNLIAIDFGCVKQLPNEFYHSFFNLHSKKTMDNSELFLKALTELEIIKESDSEDDIQIIRDMYCKFLEVFTEPFTRETFDFSDGTFMKSITSINREVSEISKANKINPGRGSEHFLYLNRTFFGLFSLLCDLKANINIKSYEQYL